MQIKKTAEQLTGENGNAAAREVILQRDNTFLNGQLARLVSSTSKYYN